MEPLSEHEEKRQHLVYKWCMVVFAWYALLIVVLGLSLTVFPQDRSLHNIVVIALVVSSVPALIAVNAMKRLTIKQRVEIGKFSLPYKTRKEKSLFFIWGGLILLMTIVLMPAVLSGKPFAIEQYRGGPKMFSLPSWTMLPLLIWGPMGLLFFAPTWQGVILFDDHLYRYYWWTKRTVFYRDLKRIEIIRRAMGKGRYAYIMVIHHVGAGESPLEIDLTLIPACDCAIILNVMQKFSPHIVMDDLAEQMRQGEFPLV